MNASTDQIRDLARGAVERVARLNATQRVALLVGSVLVVAVTIWWCHLEGQATEVLLPGQDLSSDKRSEMLKIFADAQLAGCSVVEGRIHVPRGQSQKYIAALPDGFRLQERLSHYRDEESRPSSLIETPSAASRRQALIMVHGLESVICRIKGVEDAFVHFDETIENGLKPKRISTAAVAIVTDGKTRLPRRTIDNIRRMVVSFRSGMKLSDVMVIDVVQGWSVGGPGSEESHVTSLEYSMRIQEEIERHWQDKIRGVLKFVPEAQVVVTTPTPKTDPNQPAQLELQTDRQIGVSVSVPASYHMRRLRNYRDASQTTLQQVQQDTERQIRQAIHGLIKSDQAQVAVTTFDDLPGTELASSNGWMDEVRGRNWTAGVALLVAAVGVLIVHVTSRSKPKAGRNPAATTVTLVDEPVILSQTASTLDREDSELRAALTDRIQNDPDQAVRVLNQWLSRAG